MDKISYTPEMTELLKRTASDDFIEATKAQIEFARALQLPLREGVLYGDVLGNIFEAVKYDPGENVKYPMDLLAPGEEDEFVAFTSPGIGMVGERRVQGDYVTVPTYEITNGITWSAQFARKANWNIVARAMQVLEAGFVKKINDDGWHTILSGVADRNILVYDADATQGQLTKRLVSLMKLVMIRNGGGNSASIKKTALTDMFLSPEAIEDIRNWNLDQIDEISRREIYIASDNAGVLTRVFGVNLHALYEFGVGQEYQLFYTGTLGATLQASDEELVVGLDLMNRDCFLMPYTQELVLNPDNTLQKRREVGYWGYQDCGFAMLDNRRGVAGSF